MALNIEAVERAQAGSSIEVKTVLNLKSHVKMRWGGLSLVLERPCDRNFPVVTSEIFCEGQFESGSYSRSRRLNISPRVIPSIPNQGLTYQLRADVSFQEMEKEPIIDLLDTKPIVLWQQSKEVPRAFPVNISLKGLTACLETDTFAPGERIKIDLNAERLENVRLRLNQDAKVACKCPNFGTICTHMHEKPPAIIVSAERETLRNESIILKIPDDVEESYAFSWQSSEQTGWYDSIEANSKYYLEIEGYNTSKERIQVSIPIRISRPAEETWEEPLLVSNERDALPPSFVMRPPRVLEITAHDIKEKCLILRARNVADRPLEGVTVKVAGLVEELFERSPRMIGIAQWERNEEKRLTYEKYSSEVTDYQITIEDNEGTSVTKKYSLKK